MWEDQRLVGNRSLIRIAERLDDRADQNAETHKHGGHYKNRRHFHNHLR